MNAPSTSDTSRLLTYAWVCLLGYLLSFFAAFGVGEGLSSLLGYPPGGDVRPPVWTMWVSTVPALIVFAVPGIAAWVLGRKASRAGDPRGNIPAGIGAFIALGFAALNAAAAFVPGM